jgi:hypothetical protein
MGAGVGGAGRMSIVRAVYLRIARDSRIERVRGLVRGRGLRCRWDSWVLWCMWDSRELMSRRDIRVLKTLQDIRRLTTAQKV